MVTALQAYDRLTEGRRRFVRIDELCRRAAEDFPGLVPSAQELQAETALLQRDKKGLEKRQGEFLAEVLGDEACGTHLCHAMLLPRRESPALLAELEKKGEVSLAGASLRREGPVSVVTMRNPRYLNAEDESTLEGLETAVDLALLDPATEV